MSSLFNQLGGQEQQKTPMQMLQELKANPAETLKQAGLSIPPGMNNPQQILSHLVQSGQVSNQRLQAFQQMLNTFGRR